MSVVDVIASAFSAYECPKTPLNALIIAALNMMPIKVVLNLLFGGITDLFVISIVICSRYNLKPAGEHRHLARRPMMRQDGRCTKEKLFRQPSRKP